MRGNQDFQGAMFSYISLEERVPAAHPLRKLRAVVDALLASMNSEFEAVYARRGRPSVPPEMLLKALLLQILFSIRSERQLVEAVNYNLLYRWFVGLNIEDKVWDHSTFSANRERLFNEDLARAFFERALESSTGDARRFVLAELVTQRRFVDVPERERLPAKVTRFELAARVAMFRSRSSRHTVTRFMSSDSPILATRRSRCC